MREFSKAQTLRRRLNQAELCFYFCVPSLLFTDLVIALSAEDDSSLWDVYTNFNIIFSWKTLKVLLIILILFSPISFLAMWWYGNEYGNFKGIKSVIDVTGSKYTLFLRAFEKDKTSIGERMDRMKRRIHVDESSKFMEATFLSIIPNIVTVHDPSSFLGSQVEMWTTDGIFLDNTTWKSDIQHLIEEADKVFVLVSNRPSCIIEISKTLNHLNKVFYIFDDVHEHQGICQRFPELFHPIDAKTPFCINFNGGTQYVWKFKNQVFSYDHLIKEIDVYLTSHLRLDNISDHYTDCCNPLDMLYEDGDKWGDLRTSIMLVIAGVYFSIALYNNSWHESTLLENIIFIPLGAFFSFVLSAFTLLMGMVLEWFYNRIRQFVTNKEIKPVEIIILYSIAGLSFVLLFNSRLYD